MKKIGFWLLVGYAATATALAAYAGYSVYNEDFLVLSAEQVFNVQMQFAQLFHAYQSCRAGA